MESIAIRLGGLGTWSPPAMLFVHEVTCHVYCSAFNEVLWSHKTEILLRACTLTNERTSYAPSTPILSLVNSITSGDRATEEPQSTKTPRNDMGVLSIESHAEASSLSKAYFGFRIYFRLEFTRSDLSNCRITHREPVSWGHMLPKIVCRMTESS